MLMVDSSPFYWGRIMDNKRYYYLKLKENFFDRPEIKAIEGMQSGYEYICIIQKMYLRSLSRDGKLMLTDTIPYDLKILSSVLGHKEDIVKNAIDIFNQLGLCELLDDKSIYMTEIQNFIGESSTEGDRKREYRRKIDENKQKLLSGQMSDERPPELEIELEKEIEINKEQSHSEQELSSENSKNLKFCSNVKNHKGLLHTYCKFFRKSWDCQNNSVMCMQFFNTVKKEMDKEGFNKNTNEKLYFGAFMNKIKFIIHSDPVHYKIKEQFNAPIDNKYISFEKEVNE